MSQACYFDTLTGHHQIANASFDGVYAADVRYGEVLRVDGTVPEPQSLA